jgi:putative DNA primase/helicase
MARCPVHDDRENSLSIREGRDGRALVNCFAGCKMNTVIDALGLAMTDIFPQRGSNEPSQRTIVATYEYKDRSGNPVFEVIRYNPKTFKQRRPDGAGHWIWNLEGVERVLYRLPELLAADPDTPVFVVEGEKDVDRLTHDGLVATTNPGGACKWKKEYGHELADRRVVIIPDNDSPGLRHAEIVASNLHGIAASVKVVNLPGIGAKDDVSDWLNVGHTADELLALAEATLTWVPPSGPAKVTPTDATVRFPRTDAGNGEMFAHLYGDRVRYDHRRRRWLLWSGHRWSPDCEAAIRIAAKEAVRQRYLRAVDITDEKDRRGEASWAITGESRQRVEAALYFAQSEKPISDAGEGWDEDPWLLGCPNGVVDLRTGALRPGRPDDRIILCTGVRFDPTATAPRWERFLSEIFTADVDLINWLHRALGYSVTGDTREQIVLLLHGAGSNGKSVFCAAVRSALGDYAFNTPFTTVELHQRAPIPNDVAALACRRFVTAAETNEGARLNEARVKALSGGDPTTARFLNQEFFTFQPMLKLWLAVNHLPRVHDLSHGFWRRVRTIPFHRQFTGDEQDKTLVAKLTSEAPGILAWIVRGAVEWQRRGLEPVPGPVLHATSAYKEESDPLSEFLQERCVIADNAVAAAGELYKAYAGWAEQRGLGKDERLGSRTFGERMTERFQRKHGEGGKRYRGVGLMADGSPVIPTSMGYPDPFTREGSETPVSTRQPSAGRHVADP